MIRPATIAGLLLTLATAAAQANPIVVRSGDHDGFTRLVMRLPDDVKWQVTETRGLKTVNLSGHEDGFDTRRIFDVIPRDQLTGVRSYPSRLELEISCDCTINTFVEQNAFLVLDILDGPILPPLEVKQAPRFIAAQPSSRFNFGDLLWSEVSRKTETDEGELPREVEEDQQPKKPPQEPSKAQSDFIDQTREQLLLGVGDAASRGILELAAPDLLALDEQQINTPQTEVFDSSQERVTTSIPGDGNVRITNSQDIPISGVDENFMTSGAVCADASGIAIPDWGNRQPFHTQIANLREVLYSEIDLLDQENAKRLAQAYLYFGFGAEEKQILRLSDELVSANPQLMDLADIMEHGYARNPRFVHRFSDCDSDLALWAMMAAKSVPDDSIVNANAVLRALAKLPDHLKTFLAPALSERFTARGDLEAAAIALRNIEVSNQELPSSADLAKARIEDATGNPETAEQLLNEVIEENAAETPEALIALVDNKVEKGERVPADIALLIETYAFERRHEALATDLLRAHVLAASYSGQFNKAFQVMQREEISEDPEFLAEMQSRTFLALSLFASDIDFLDGFYDHFPQSALSLTNASTLETAARLLELGFASEADSILSKNSDEQKSDEEKILHATVFLALENPQAAINLLDGLGSEHAIKLRAEALLDLGQNQSAFNLFQATDTAEEAVRSAWLADEWVDLMPSDTPVFDEFRELAKEPISAIESSDTMLSTAAAELDQTASARETLNQLLQSFQISP